LVTAKVTPLATTNVTAIAVNNIRMRFIRAQPPSP
jgi:hypothetical protein